MSSNKRRREDDDDGATASSDEEAATAAAAASAAAEETPQPQQQQSGGGAKPAAAATALAEAATAPDGGGSRKGSGSGSGGGGGGGGSSSSSAGSRYRYAVVCSSNVNRSMEAHVALFNNRLRVGSYGAGRFVRLPVPGGLEGRSFEFGTPYETMEAELLAKADSKAQEFYRRTKLIDILRRNKQIKRAPERWQDLEAEAVAGYDVVVCFEQRIYDAVVEDLLGREPRDLEPICVICMETKDDPKEAIIAGRATVKLAQQLEQCEDLASEAPEVVESFMAAEGRRLLFQVHYL